jgi:hypothetical protein
LEFGGFGFPSSSSLAQSALTFKHQRARALSLSTLGARRSIRFFFFSVSVIHISIFYGQIALVYFQFLLLCVGGRGVIFVSDQRSRPQYESDSPAAPAASQSVRGPP